MTFKFDRRDIADNLSSSAQQNAFVTAVLRRMNSGSSSGGITKGDPEFAAVVGMLVLDSYTDPKAAEFNEQFWNVRGEAAGTTKDSKGADVPNKTIYNDVAQTLDALPNHKNNVYYQELATVSRKLIDNADEVPYDDPNFVSQIGIFDNEYVVNGPQGAGSLDIPDLSDPASAAGPDDIRKANIEAVAVIAAAYHLEKAGLFASIDRIMETWWNGQLPVGFDSGSKALDDLYWQSDDLLTPTARHMQYGRVLGAPEGEVSTEVQPNTQFDDLLKRFVASLAEYDRQSRVAEIVGNQRKNALTLTAEQVRQSGRNLAANTSLYGWGGTQFAARRMAGHIKKSFAILNSRDIQAAYGVDGPWKVVERVSQELGSVPNIVKWQTLAAATKSMLDLVAKYHTIWSGGTGKPLFTDSGSGVTTQNAANYLGDEIGTLTDELHKLVQIAVSFQSGTGPTTTVAGPGTATSSAAATAAPARPKKPTRATVAAPDISEADRDELMRQAGNYIAVNGIKDEAVEELSQPAEAQYAPSVPGLAGMPATNGAGGLDQLRQMVSQGQVPSLDQLKSIVMPSS
jgi:hypothetical protein